MRNDNCELVSLSQAFSIKIQHIFYGGNFAGHWRNNLPVNRLIYILKKSPIPSRIIGEEDVFEMNPGCWLLIPAGCRAEHEQYEGLDLVSIHFNLMYYSNPEFFVISREMYQGAAPEREKEFRQLTYEKETGLADILHLQNLISSFLLPVMEKEQPRLTQYFQNLQTFQVLFDHFRREPQRNFSIEDMAEIMKMGKENFVKKFTAGMKISPKKFFNRLRAANAAYRLTGSRTAVRKIAEDFGFANEFYFSRFIKQHLGMSPRQLRDSRSLPM